MARIWFEATIDQLEALVGTHRADPAVLGQVWEELTFRDTARAQQLMREVLGLLNGVIPQPAEPARAARPEDQIKLL